MFAGDGVGGVAHDEVGVHAVHHGGVAALADAHDPAVADAHVGLDHAQFGVDDGHVGDHEVEHARRAIKPGVAAHAAAQGFAAAVHGFVAVVAQVLFDFNIQVGIAKPDFVPHGGTEEGRMFLTGNSWHEKTPFGRVEGAGLTVWRS